MAARETGEIRGFVQQMEKAIKRIGAPPVRKKAEFFAFQEAQFKNIVALEQEFRERVTTGPEELGRRVYEAFIAYAKTLSSIMSARSYFRERQTAFADTLGQAIQDGDWAYLASYRVNFRFVGWAVKTGLLDEPVFQKLARTILRQRDEMIVLLMPLGINRARMFRGKTPPSHLDLLDQVQGAFEGLITGVDKYIEEVFTTRYRGVAVGRMTGELIEMYSETLLHFYPLDKKILYRANKIHGRMVRSGGTDFEALADELNRDEAQKAMESEVPRPADFATSGPEVAELMAAASHVSADAVLGGARRIVHRMVAPADQAPDVLAERSEGVAAVRVASRKLSLMQRKLLVLRGMLPVEEVVT